MREQLARKGNKRHPSKNRRNTTVTIHISHDIIYQNPKRLLQKLLELINKFSKVEG